MVLLHLSKTAYIDIISIYAIIYLWNTLLSKHKLIKIWIKDKQDFEYVEKHESDVNIMVKLHPVTKEFSNGIDDQKPSANTVNVVDILIKNIEHYGIKNELSHDIDGAISFIIITRTDALISGEITCDGNLYGFLYRDDWHTLSEQIIQLQLVIGDELNEWLLDG